MNNFKKICLKAYDLFDFTKLYFECTNTLNLQQCRKTKQKGNPIKRVNTYCRTSTLSTKTYAFNKNTTKTPSETENNRQPTTIKPFDGLTFRQTLKPHATHNIQSVTAQF